MRIVEKNLPWRLEDAQSDLEYVSLVVLSSNIRIEQNLIFRGICFGQLHSIMAASAGSIMLANGVRDASSHFGNLDAVIFKGVTASERTIAHRAPVACPLEAPV